MKCEVNTADICGFIHNDATLSWLFSSHTGPNYPATGPQRDYTGNIADGYLLFDSSAQVVSQNYPFSPGHGRLLW